MLRRSSIALVTALALVGCASPTPYGAAQDGYGYSDIQLEANRYLVTFSGNSLTPRQSVEVFLLYRAAEITLATGNDHFILGAAGTERSTSYRTTYNGGAWGPWGGIGYSSYGSSVFAGLSTGYTTEVNRYEASTELQVFPGPKPAGDPDAYDAREVETRLRPIIERLSSGQTAAM